VNFFVVPAYDEEANLPRLLRDLEARPALWSGGRVIVVDDGSRDGTAEVADAHSGPLPVEVIRLGTNQGPGRAFDRGFRRALELASEDAMVVTLEADTTSDLDALDGMLRLARGGADVVLASTHAPGGGLAGVGVGRRVLSRTASYAIRRTSGVDARTVSTFFRVYRASILRAGYARHGDALVRERGFACKAELLFKLARLGARLEEVPVVIDWSRRAGESKMRVLPTVVAYMRLMTRQAVARRGEEAA
jgi:dolichol-phosphate mannosyltransferase